MYADSTQMVIDQTRRKSRFHPFHHLKFWLIQAIILLALMTVLWALRFLYLNRAELYALLKSV
jgi:hypothetical protein